MHTTKLFLELKGNSQHKRIGRDTKAQSRRRDPGQMPRDDQRARTHGDNALDQ
jgi:hypothetical protein